jgi:hypothetical protein
LNYFQNVVREINSGRMIWVGYVSHIGEVRNAYKILVINLKRRCHRWDSNINMDLK